MASSSRALTRLAGPQFSARVHLKLSASAPALAPAARAVGRVANITTTSPARKTSLSSTSITRIQPSQILSRQFRRAYADSAPIVPVKRRKIRVFRWVWRLTYLSILGGIGFIVYDGFLARNPDDQFTPDPSKKTLVVLGKSLLQPLALGARYELS